MLSDLSPNERETLLLFAQDGAGGLYDMNALGKLFSLGLLTIGDCRRIELTTTGRATCAKIQATKHGEHDGAPLIKKTRRSE
jgi:hypothetical protein